MAVSIELIRQNHELAKTLIKDTCHAFRLIGYFGGPEMANKTEDESKVWLESFREVLLHCGSLATQRSQYLGSRSADYIEALTIASVDFEEDQKLVPSGFDVVHDLGAAASQHFLAWLASQLEQALDCDLAGETQWCNPEFWEVAAEGADALSTSGAKAILTGLANRLESSPSIDAALKAMRTESARALVAVEAKQNAGTSGRTGREYSPSSENQNSENGASTSDLNPKVRASGTDHSRNSHASLVAIRDHIAKHYCDSPDKPITYKEMHESLVSLLKDGTLDRFLYEIDKDWVPSDNWKAWKKAADSYEKYLQRAGGDLESHH